MEQFKEALSGEGRTIQTVASYLQQYVNEQWQQVFQQRDLFSTSTIQLALRSQAGRCYRAD
jgi:hypothetical protein